MRDPTRRGTSGDPSRHEVHLVLPREVTTIGPTRKLARALLLAADADPEVASAVALGLSELCTNAVLHASGSSYEVTIRVTAPQCEIVVVDQGPGFDPAAVAAPTIDRPYGRGLTILRASMDEVFIESAPGSATTVVASKRLVALEPDNEHHAPRQELATVIAKVVEEFVAILAAVGGTIRLAVA